MWRQRDSDDESSCVNDCGDPDGDADDEGMDESDALEDLEALSDKESIVSDCSDD